MAALYQRLLARCLRLLGRPLGLVERADLTQRRPQPFDLVGVRLPQDHQSGGIGACVVVRRSPPRLIGHLFVCHQSSNRPICHASLTPGFPVPSRLPGRVVRSQQVLEWGK
jgi:hypothetical protein